MKIDFTLSEQHQIILGLIYQEGGELTIARLEKLYYLTSFLHDDAVKIDVAKILPYMNLQVLQTDMPIKDLEKDIQGLEFIGLLTRGLLRGRQGIWLVLTEEGSRLAKAIQENRRLILRPKHSLQTTVFIACAFGYSDVDELYNSHLADACENLGYKPVRVDMTEPHQTITEKIMEGITVAACVIADLTYARPSVYFEVGYAVGLGIPLVATCRKDHFRGAKDDQRIHFDLEQYKTSFWEINPSGGFTWQSELMRPDKRLTLILQSRK